MSQNDPKFIIKSYNSHNKPQLSTRSNRPEETNKEATKTERVTLSHNQTQ